MGMLVCPICGEQFQDRMHLGSHMWSVHKTKMKEYEKSNGQIMPMDAAPAQVDEAKCSDGLMKPRQMVESRSILPEPAVKVDRDFVTEKAVSDGELLKSKNETKNPYRDLYPSEGNILNEWLSR